MGGGMMGKVYARRGWVIAAVVALVVALAAVVGVGGCASKTSGGESSPGSVAFAGVSTTAAANTASRAPSVGEPAAGVVEDSNQAVGGDVTAELTVLQQASGQKIVSDAQLDVEVKSGEFQNAFAQALLIADRYGGYLVSSSSQASGEEGSLKSGTIAIRVPSTSFDKALSDAAKLGEVKNRQVQTQDVTEEYVDLQARITNSQAHVQAVLALLAKAKTVDEVLQVQQVLTAAQQELEQLRGRQRYLDEHTSYSTVTLSIYETGAIVTPASTWGMTQALTDGLHNLVNAFNAIVRGLGVLVPVLIVLADHCVRSLSALASGRPAAARARSGTLPAVSPGLGRPAQPVRSGPRGSGSCGSHGGRPVLKWWRSGSGRPDIERDEGVTGTARGAPSTSGVYSLARASKERYFLGRSVRSREYNSILHPCSGSEAGAAKTVGGDPTEQL